MSYTSRRGRRPSEYASKSSHSFIINDPDVSGFLANCDYPKDIEDVDFDKIPIYTVKNLTSNPIKNVIAIDGGRTEIPVRREFPSSVLTFFQFGALYFTMADLENLYIKPFIEPSEISKLKEIQRLKFILPTKNIRVSGMDTLKNSVRKSIYDFFMQNPQGDKKFIESFKWLLFEDFHTSISFWNLASCPTCGQRDIKLKTEEMEKDYTFKCPSCKEIIYLTDTFRLHEIIDNEIGAGGIIGYLGNVLEQVVLIHLIWVILQIKPSLLNEVLFIKDGQLAFFGQTANIHEPMKALIIYLIEKHSIYLAGLEKSGAFVEHADEIADKLTPGTAILLNNDYIYRYIIPGRPDAKDPYGSTTYYGRKVIYKADDERIYVVTLPTGNIAVNPEAKDFPNIDIILQNIKKLKCDMYDSSLIPVSLVNNLVSLSNHPSSVILEKFARNNIASR